MSNVITASKALETIQSAAAAVEIRPASCIRIGDRLHQGDVYLCRVGNGHPRGKILGTKQVAVGTTVGSRHVVDGDASVYAGEKLPPDMRIDSSIGAAAYLGPVVVVGCEGATLTHPEHAHHELAEGVYQVTYQVDMATRQRVAD